MTAGEIYDAYDPELVIMRKRCNSLSDAFNHLGDEKLEERREILGKLLGSAGTNIYMLPTLHLIMAATRILEMNSLRISISQFLTAHRYISAIMFFWGRM